MIYVSKDAKYVFFNLTGCSTKILIKMFDLGIFWKFCHDHHQFNTLWKRIFPKHFMFNCHFERILVSSTVITIYDRQNLNDQLHFRKLQWGEKCFCKALLLPELLETRNCYCSTFKPPSTTLSLAVRAKSSSPLTSVFCKLKTKTNLLVSWSLFLSFTLFLTESSQPMFSQKNE